MVCRVKVEPLADETDEYSTDSESWAGVMARKAGAIRPQEFNNKAKAGPP